ncbi:MAG: esterase family protein [Fibrobacteres bacterium]|nr:esterase family protein [Fibrobacterota bacterium]
MAKIECSFYSYTLKLSTAMTVILPINENTTVQKMPVLWLLHGLSDDHTAWTRKTSIERYAEKRGLAVVMPEAGRSYYTDMVHGLDYWTFISKELPAIARKLFPLSEKREENFVAGLSMGGYGALKLAFSFPEKYAAAASMSGAVDPYSFLTSVKNDKERIDIINNVFGKLKSIPGSDNDLTALAKKNMRKKIKLPAIYQCCGTGDFLYGDNLRFRDFLKKSNIKAEYKESPGTHEWGYWDASIQDVLRWLPLKKPSI